MKTRLLLAGLFMTTCMANGFSQNANTPATPFVLGLTEHLKSVELSEERTLNIYLPENYANDTTHYPVIYLLDGSANEDFVHIAGLIQFEVMIGKMPPSILVGIANVNRKRDFTFPTSVDDDRKLVPTSGGSEKFMAFIEKELQPYITQHYRTTARKTLIGQSLGGLMASEILLKKTALFSDYIIISPSLWWNNESLLKDAPILMKGQTYTDLKIFIAVGTEGEKMEKDAAALSSLMKKAPRKNTDVHFVLLSEENHLTILHNSVYKAFEYLNKK